MNFDNISSIQYLFELNNWPKNFTDKDIAFLNKNRPELFRKCLDTFLAKIVTTDGSDVNLRYFYTRALGEYMEDASYGLTLLIFPASGEIKKYCLNPKGNFFTNLHKNPDPILIKMIKMGLFIHPEQKDDSFYYHRQRKTVPNRINEVLLFKRNPVENKRLYEGFEDFLNHKYK